MTRVMKQGAPSLADYPYTTECKRPPPQVVSRVHDFRVSGFRNLDISKLDNVKGQLARSHPVIISFSAGPTFDNFKGGVTYTDTDKGSPGNPKWGWHAMTLVGYDDRRQAFQLINSWGTKWGDGGFAWISYDVFKALVRRASVLEVEVPRRPVAFSPPAPSPSPDPPPRPVATVVVTPPPKPPAVGPVAVTPPKPPPVSPVAVTPPAPPPKPPAVVTPVPVRPPPPPPRPKVEPVPVQPLPAPAPVAPPSAALGLSDLQKLACAHITTTVQGGKTILDGYVASDEDLATVEQIAAVVPNTSLGEIFVAPWPQCEALQSLDAALATEGRPEVVIDPKGVFRAGETLKIEVRAPAQISYIYVAYVQADGTVVHLVQPAGVVPQPSLPGQALIFGDGQVGRQKFTVGPPFGREMIIALASRSPLFDSELPTQQTERDYLTELRKALIYKPSPDLPDREVSASAVFLETYER